MVLRDNNGEVKKFDKLPEGWKFVPGASTAPIGYAWAFNGESLFSGNYKSALVKI